jgi:hypothetical protein
MAETLRRVVRESSGELALRRRRAHFVDEPERRLELLLPFEAAAQTAVAIDDEDVDMLVGVRAEAATQIAVLVAQVLHAPVGLGHLAARVIVDEAGMPMKSTTETTFTSPPRAPSASLIRAASSCV